MNNVLNFYNNYFLHQQGTNLYFGIKTYNNNDLPSITGVPTFTSVNAYNTGSAPFQTPQIQHITSAFVSVPGAIDKTSLAILSTMDKKFEGDTPLSGAYQAVFIAGAIISGTDTSVSYIRVSNSNVNTAFQYIYAAPSFVNNNQIPSMSLAMPEFVHETGTASPLVSNMTSWSTIGGTGIFNPIPVTGTSGAYVASTNIITSLELVKPIYGLIS